MDFGPQVCFDTKSVFDKITETAHAGARFQLGSHLVSHGIVSLSCHLSVSSLTMGRLSAGAQNSGYVQRIGEGI